MTAKRRRVFIASGLPMRDLRNRFKTLIQKYDIVVEEDKAEYVVLDLNYPATMWSNYLKRRDVTGALLKPKDLVPCLLVSLSTSQQPGSGASSQDACSNRDSEIRGDILEQIGSTFKVKPRVCTSVQGVVDELEWLECMLPFFKCDPETVNSAAREIAIALSRLGGGRDD